MLRQVPEWRLRMKTTNNTMQRIHELREKNTHYWGERIAHEMELCFHLANSIPEAAVYATQLAETVDWLSKEACDSGAITRIAALESEKRLMVFEPLLKQYRILCVAQAHIDMNWMWGFAETVSITLDTFRTVLKLMNEYPEFTYTQSQAAVYRIIEEHEPAMLEEIKQRIKEGRWEVTATHWVEADKNMPSGESLTRHILYTKRYLSELLNIDSADLCIDYEPDTFGHNLNVPEIDTNAGVKYMYHVRGYKEGSLYYYQSPSGARILAYCDPYWYNSDIYPAILVNGLDISLQLGMQTSLKIYGAGNHGGGPTRKDVERLIDMAKWPLAPRIEFSNVKEFFLAAEREVKSIPVETKELNYIFDGCYTSYSRIKAANRIGELRLSQAEMLCAYATTCFGHSYDKWLFESSWRKILFNHFHDILPGAGIQDTREHAMGAFSEVLAAANTKVSQASQAIIARIDISGLLSSGYETNSTSEGAGVGFGIADFGIPNTERGRGRTRIFHVFNTTAYDRAETVRFTLWDWPYGLDNLCILDTNGNAVAHQFICDNDFHKPKKEKRYWWHDFVELLIDVTCPAMGYNTYQLTAKPMNSPLIIPWDPTRPNRPRIMTPTEFVLENDAVRVEFNPNNLNIISFYDKKANKELIDSRKGGAGLRYIEEDPIKDFSAWIVGRHMSDVPAFEHVSSHGIQCGTLSQRLHFSGNVKSSKVNGTISLNNSGLLEYSLYIDWFERSQKEYIPQLAYSIPLAYSCDDFDCDIPYGVINRKPIDMDIPALSFACANDTDDTSGALMLISQTKYGFRCHNNRLLLNLLRSPSWPELYTDIGIHKMSFAIAPFSESSCAKMLQMTQLYNTPLFSASNPCDRSVVQTEPLSGSLLRDVQGCVVMSVKLAEDSDDLVIRFCEPEGNNAKSSIRFALPVKRAQMVDGNEQAVDSPIVITDDVVSFTVDAHKSGALKITL